jgi:hypothetical protein
MVQAVLRDSGVLVLSCEVIQNEVVIEDWGNKLIRVMLLALTPHHFNQQSTRPTSSVKRA